MEHESIPTPDDHQPKYNKHNPTYYVVTTSCDQCKVINYHGTEYNSYYCWNCGCFNYWNPNLNCWTARPDIHSGTAAHGRRNDSSNRDADVDRTIAIVIDAFTDIFRWILAGCRDRNERADNSRDSSDRFRENRKENRWDVT